MSACQVGYYGNIQTRVCEKCSNHCLLCLHAHTCLQCVPGYIPLDGVCVDSLSCSAYQSQYNGICVDGCPIGTCKDGYTCKPVCLEGRYFHDGFCYTDCPTGHHTPEACVQNCNGYDNCLWKWSIKLSFKLSLNIEKSIFHHI